MTHGPLQDRFDLSFATPSVCADRLAAGEADIGLVPCAELDPQALSWFPETGIACRGAVRSILLISRVEPSRIRTLAADVSSRTSVMLARIILQERYGVAPSLVSMAPDADRMLAHADAALIIGDPALRIDPSIMPRVLDLGAEWWDLTGLPMVFAVWAGKQQHITREAGEVFVQSTRYGLDRIEEIAAAAPSQHGIPTDLARTYLTRHIVFQLGDDEHRGMELYRRKVAELRASDVNVPATLGR
jgi:predicted solute-binding protein